ncbi:hypothetical protein TRFO_13078 [Tritrichomonas foetus]|uniref:Uncharacterized protein n=1 Tax=Tritrichomonas foetus TaxID=1144522 RepID=A0A1J4L0J0_9EUKA|nr:hypothetical protein TRFO_13078 [Tritrichomonas foetus]|eukprot:OHT16648.1 hypothetical protein TRFO_13078 [Tritrichomonas foetus]
MSNNFARSINVQFQNRHSMEKRSHARVKSKKPIKENRIVSNVKENRQPKEDDKIESYLNINKIVKRTMPKKSRLCTWEERPYVKNDFKNVDNEGNVIGGNGGDKDDDYVYPKAPPKYFANEIYQKVKNYEIGGNGGDIDDDYVYPRIPPKQNANNNNLNYNNNNHDNYNNYNNHNNNYNNLPDNENNVDDLIVPNKSTKTNRKSYHKLSKKKAEYPRKLAKANKNRKKQNKPIKPKKYENENENIDDNIDNHIDNNIRVKRNINKSEKIYRSVHYQQFNGFTKFELLRYLSQFRRRAKIFTFWMERTIELKTCQMSNKQKPKFIHSSSNNSAVVITAAGEHFNRKTKLKDASNAQNITNKIQEISHDTNDSSREIFHFTSENDDDNVYQELEEEEQGDSEDNAEIDENQSHSMSKFTLTDEMDQMVDVVLSEV